MEEISTPTAVVEDTSVTNETAVEKTATSDVTEPETTQVAETTTENVATQEPQEEKLYAGKYKSIEDLEKGYKEAEKSFNKVAELEKRIKEFEAQKPKYVNEQGKINPEIKAHYDFALDNQEFMAYQDLSNSLDNESRLEVENILNEAKRLYNPKNKQAYQNKLAEAKNYFNSSIVEGIARNKMNLEKKYADEMAGFEQKERQKMADYFAEEIKKEPELYALVNPESEEHSPEVLGIVKSMFDAYRNIDVGQTMKAINKIKELGVKQYLAKQSFEQTKEQANVKSGGQVSTQPSNLPTGDEMRKNPDLYMKVAKKYGEAKADEILMKG